MPNKPQYDLESRTEEFALRIIRLCRALPKDDVGKILGRQLLRSGTSVGANYHEAACARSKPEFIAKVGDSLREANESAYWLSLLVRADIISEEKLNPLRTECTELIAIFSASIATARRHPDESRP